MAERMMLFIRVPWNSRNPAVIQRDLVEEGWDILCTCKKPLKELTRDELAHKYDFGEAEIERFLGARDALVTMPNTITIMVPLNATTVELKEILHEREAFPLEEMRLIYAGRQLYDDQTLEDRDIQESTTLHLLVRLRGD